MIEAQLAACRWSRLFPGVYSTRGGDEPTIEAWWWAAHLAIGDESTLAADTALQAWGICMPTLPVHLAIPWSRQRMVAGQLLVVRRHRSPALTRVVQGLPPVVAAAEAFVDVTETLSDAESVIALLSKLFQRRAGSVPEVHRVMERRRRVRHRRLLRELLGEFVDGATTPLEIPGVRRIMRGHGLPPGAGQVRELIGGHRRIRDRVIARYGVVIEFDGRLGHADPLSRLRDHARDNEVIASGRVVLRFGWVDVHEEACESAAQVAGVLKARGWRGQLEPCGPRCRATAK